MSLKRKSTSKNAARVNAYRDTPRGQQKSWLDNYRRGASVRGFSFDLTDDQAVQLGRQACWYCGAFGHSSLRGLNGIDRLDSRVGYTEANTVPCCWNCNRAKGDVGYDDFIRWLAKISERVPTLKKFCSDVSEITEEQE